MKVRIWTGSSEPATSTGSNGETVHGVLLIVRWSSTGSALMRSVILLWDSAMWGILTRQSTEFGHLSTSRTNACTSTVRVEAALVIATRDCEGCLVPVGAIKRQRQFG